MPLTPDEQYQEAVKQRQAELMAGDYAPLDAANFDEAISECLADLHGGMSQTIISLLHTQYGPYVIARLLLAVPTEYMASVARLKAENMIAEEAAEGNERTKRAVPAGVRRMVVEMGVVA